MNSEEKFYHDFLKYLIKTVYNGNKKAFIKKLEDNLELAEKYNNQDYIDYLKVNLKIVRNMRDLK